MLLNSHQFKFLKNYRNVNVKSNAKREYRAENVFLKGDRALSNLITLLISNKKESNHFFKSISSDFVLLKRGNLHQNAKRSFLRAKRADFFFLNLHLKVPLLLFKALFKFCRYFFISWRYRLMKYFFFTYDTIPIVTLSLDSAWVLMG